MLFIILASIYNSALYEKYIAESVLQKDIKFHWKDALNLFDISKKLTEKE